MESMKTRTHELMQAIGITEEPFGVYYAAKKPENAFGPKEGPEISRELEARDAINWGEVFQKFSCIMGNIWLARKKKRAAFISDKEYGCFGGAFYAGHNPEYTDFQVDYVSMGRPGTPMHGERYISPPQAMRKFMDDLSPPAAPAQYCILKPLDQFDDATPPEYIIFFTRMESLVGLQTLAYFTTGDVNVVATHFGSACSHIISWPRAYAAKGVERAVLGGCDPSARKFMKPDEMLLTIPLGLYRKMLDAMPESLLGTETWSTVMKKVNKSNSVWDEGKAAV